VRAASDPASRSAAADKLGGVSIRFLDLRLRRFAQQSEIIASSNSATAKSPASTISTWPFAASAPAKRST
jgi:hypothetical protein